MWFYVADIVVYKICHIFANICLICGKTGVDQWLYGAICCKFTTIKSPRVVVPV